MYYKLAPSILAADFTRLGEQVKEVYGASAEYLHLDVMDGAFVPSISFGMPVIKNLHPCTRAVFNVHMVVEGPGRYVKDMKDCGADAITVQVEACIHLDCVANQVKEAGLKVGVALNPATPVRSLECILGQLDMVLIMTVNPGFEGQKFIPYTLNKVRELRDMLNEQGLKTDIQADGGVNTGNVREIIDAGADISVAGPAVLGRDPSARTREFMGILKEYEKWSVI